MIVPPQPRPPQTPLAEFFGPRHPLRMIIVGTLALAALVPLTYLAFGFDYLGMGENFKSSRIKVYVLLFFLFFPFVVVLVPGNTHRFRDILAWPVIVLGAGAIVLGSLLLASRPGNELDGIGLILGGAIAIISVTLVLNPILAFGIPSNWMTACLLFLATLFLINPLGLLAGAWMPPHRRLKCLWKPKSLPRLPRRKGMTLIELLITIALIAIFSVAMVHVSQVAHGAAERQERWREATALGIDAIADLRSQPALPADGEYPVGAAVAELHPKLKDRASVMLSPGPVPGARLAEVRVELNDNLDRRVVKLAALIAEAPGP